MTSNAKTNRRSLKECLKTILQRRRDDHHDDHMTVGYGISKRRDTSLASPSLTTQPNFELSRFDIHQNSVSDSDTCNLSTPDVAASAYSQHAIVPDARPESSLSPRDIRDAYQYQTELGQLAKSCSVERDWYSTSAPGTHLQVPPAGLNLIKPELWASQESVLPDTIPSQLITPYSIHFQSPLSQLAHACNVPSIYRQGASLQASLATLPSPTWSASTLRLQRSIQDLNPNRVPNPTPHSKRDASLSPLVVTTSVSALGKGRLPRKTSDGSLLLAPPDAVSSLELAHDHRAPELEAGLSSINHFSSFCVLDTATPGCLVTATSADLRLVFDIGEEFCLNSAGIDGASMETVTGHDEDGNVRIHLVVYNPLINPSSGRSRFVLASLLDITSFIIDAASVPDLETISEESFIEEELKTPTQIQVHQSPRYGLTANDLLGGCFLPEDGLHTLTHGQKGDIWLDIASEETRPSRSVKSAPGTPRSTSSARSSTRSMDDVLDQFLASLQNLYSEFFLLGKSPLDENSYEICNVSPKVHATREYIEGHLTRTSREAKAHLEEQLTHDESFRMTVRWGVVGKSKQLYCVPLFGRSNVTWVCFLVEEGKWPGLPLWE